MPDPAAPRTPLEPSRDVERELLRLLEASAHRPLVGVAREDRLHGLGIEGEDLAHLRYHVRRAFHVDVGPDARTVQDVLGPVEDKAWWRYAPPPGQRAVDLARGDFGARLLRPVLHALFRLALRALVRYRVRGRRHLPRRGPFILVANHAGHPDAPALMAALPLARVNDTHPLAAQDYFFARPLVGKLVHGLLNALPVDRRAHVHEALGDALVLLEDGRGVVLFPEGTRSPDGQVQPFKRGVGFLAAGKPWPVVPAWIEGSRDVMPKGATRPRLGRQLLVRVGAPRSFADRPDTREEWARIAKELEEAVRALGRDARA